MPARAARRQARRFEAARGALQVRKSGHEFERTRGRPRAPREPKAGQTRPRDGIDAGDSTRWIHLRAVGYPQPILREQAGGLGRAGLHPAARPSPPPLPRGPLAFTGERAQGLRYGPELATFVKGLRVFDEEACERRARARYVRSARKVTVRDMCPPCLDLTAQVALGDAAVATLEQESGRIFVCPGGPTSTTTTGPPTTTTAPVTTTTRLPPTSTTATTTRPLTTTTQRATTTTTRPPPTSTTATTSSTTLLPCGGLYPVCLGSCPTGLKCKSDHLLAACVCE